MGRVGWLDCSSGVSGDMLLGALAHLGALDGLPAVLDSAPELGAAVAITTVTRGALEAQRVDVTTTDTSPPPRTRRDVQLLLDSMTMPSQVRQRAEHVFDRLAAAESQVHGIDVGAVHFHEVGAVDTVVDVVGACLGLHSLGLDALTCSPIALGSGTAATQHGSVPLPGPAVLALLQETSLAALGGDGEGELATPTGVAIVAEFAERGASMPAMRVDQIGIGAGARDSATRPNVVRLVVGGSADADSDWLLVEANVDDLDPRLLPGVIDALLAAGAADAWLTPILMKKGRPAHVVSALTTADSAQRVRAALFAESSTIGARTTRVDKFALDREWIEVDVDGQRVRIKLARHHGSVVSVNPEWEDVRTAATALSRPAKDVLAAATALARRALS